MSTRYSTHITNGPRQAMSRRCIAAICLLTIGFATNELAVKDARAQAPAGAKSAYRLPPVPESAALPPALRGAELPAAPQLPERSDQMEMIARESDEKIRDGMDLAYKPRAAFAARSDFIAALRLVAQGLDADAATQRHSQALAASLTAMKEAQDFVPGPGRVESELELASVVAGHRTPILKNVPAERLQAMWALKQYFNYAQDQLCAAAGHEVSASMALAALGKLHASMADKENPEIALADAKAIVFFQAAILVLPQNYIAANDLGVLMAHRNDFATARAALEHSVQVFRCSENLRNLSSVYRQMGEMRLAEMAARDAEAAGAVEFARKRATHAGGVDWVDTESMARASSQWTDMPARSSPNAAARGAMSAPTVGQAAGPVGGAAR